MLWQMGWLVFALRPGRTWQPPEVPGVWFGLASTYIWHLLIVPVLLILLCAGWIVRRLVPIRRLFERKPNDSSSADEIEKSDPASGFTVTDTHHEPDGSFTDEPSAADAVVHSAISRRRFIGAGLALAPPLLAGGGLTKAVWEANEFRIRRFDLVFDQLPKELDKLTISHVSDIHVGDFTHGKVLDRIAQATNELRSDLVLVTGDLINRSLSELPVGINIIRQLDPGYGLAMCEGNHDLFESRALFDSRVKRAGIKLLVDESMLIQIRGRLVQILGMQWGPAHSGGISVMPQSMAHLNTLRQPDAFTILLAHHPDALDYAAASNIPLTLSGHTHGGQIMLSRQVGFGPMMYRYWSGHYRRGDSQMIVSNGVGNWLPLRINAPAELVHITLHRGQPA